MNNEIETSGTTELEAVIGTLLDTLDDKNENVRLSVHESIRKLSEQYPETAIHSCIYFWELHKKISSEHVGSLLQVMSNLCLNHGKKFNADVASLVTEVAMHELLGPAEIEASKLLISLSTTHCPQAMGGLITKLEPGVLPQLSIIRTIGMIASNNPYGMLPFFKMTFCIMVPMLSTIRDDGLKQTFCFTLGKCCEAINHYLMNLEEGKRPEINKQTYKEEVSDFFDILSHNWLKTRDNKLTEAALNALVDLIPLLPTEDENDKMIKLVPVLLTHCKRPNLRLPAVKVLAILLNYPTDKDKESLRPFVEQIHQNLFELISVSPFEASRDVLLAHYQALQCSRSLVVLYPEEGLDRTLHQLKSSVVTQRSRALVVLRHLINTLPTEDEGNMQKIALNLQDSLGETSVRQMVGAIVALAARTTFPLLPSQRALFVHYMVSHCGFDKNDETEANAEALHLLATTVEGAEIWLWPCLIKYFLEPSCVNSTVAILRALTPLVKKIIHKEDSSNLEKDFPSMKVLSRCLELLGNPINRPSILIFLKSSAPLFGHQLTSHWDSELTELLSFIQKRQKNDAQSFSEWEHIWEERIIGFLEKSVQLEGDSWCTKLTEELALKINIPHAALYFSAICESPSHISSLIELARSQNTNEEFSRAVGICAKRHLKVVLKIMEECCLIEDHKKLPVKLLGLMKDTKAAASAEAAKAGLLKCYAEIAHKGDAKHMVNDIEKHISNWIIRQLNDCKDFIAKEAGLIALEQIANALHPDRLSDTMELYTKNKSLATLLHLLQSCAGYRPLLLYPLILKTMVSLIRIPPELNSEERGVLISTVLDKIIAASTELTLQLQPNMMQQVINSSGIVCSEIVSDSADALAELIDILLTWMQSKSSTERKTALLILRITLRSYSNSSKYTFPGGKLEPGKLLGRTLSWSADPEYSLRPIVIDCVILSLKINYQLRGLTPDTNLDQHFNELKSTIIGENSESIYQGVRNLAAAVCEKVPEGETISLAEGLIEGLLFRGEAGLAAGIALNQHFQIKGSQISRNDVYLLDNIVSQMRQMENVSCRREAANAIKSLMAYNMEQATERLLAQPLPLDRGVEDCWKEIGHSNDLGSSILLLLMHRLENNNLLAENPNLSQPGKNNTASFPSLAAIIALRNLLQSSDFDNLMGKHLARLLLIVWKYLAGWLRVDAPISIISTKFGYVPNREASKINPRAEVYLVLNHILNVIDTNLATSLNDENVFESDLRMENDLIDVVKKTIKHMSSRKDVLLSLARSLGQLMTSANPAQRLVAATFYSELIGKVDIDFHTLEDIIESLYNAKEDSSPLVRKLSTMGLVRTAYLEPRRIKDYFHQCIDILLQGLEETTNAEGGNEVVLESLRGLSVLAIQYEFTISPSVVLALKPFIGKENWEIKLAAINALGAVACNWKKFITSPDDDITDHLLGCIPCLIIRLEDSNSTVIKTTQETLWNFSGLIQCPALSQVLQSHLAQNVELHFNKYIKDLIDVLKEHLPNRADELRNEVVRGYSRSENSKTRATAALILGFFGPPTPEDVQRLLQLLRDKESDVRIRAAEALSLSFTRETVIKE